MESFVIDAFDNSLCYPVASFPVSADICHSILREDSGALDRLDGGEPIMLSEGLANKAYRAIGIDIGFEPRFLGIRPIEWARQALPYLVHTGFELPLFLSGKKKLGWLDFHPDMDEFELFRLKCFEDLVTQGVLVKQERLVKRARGSSGQVFYTPPAEAWRVKAYEMAKEVSGQSGGWNEGFEQILGALMGYSAEENRAWISDCMRRNIFPSGMRLYCALSAIEAQFVENTGFRSLPWSRESPLVLRNIGPETVNFDLLLDRCPGTEVVAKIIVPLLPLQAISQFDDPYTYSVSATKIASLNRLLQGAIEFVYKSGAG